MGTEIFYFSGTGNCLSAAKELADKMQAAIVPIASLKDRETVETDADIIGFVFPVYYGELPVIVRDFARKLTGINGKYIFAVCTYGGGASRSLEILKGILKEKGGMLSAGFGIHMPQNAFRKPWENNRKIYAACSRRLASVAGTVESGEQGMFYENRLLQALLLPMHELFKPLYKKGFLKYSNAPKDTPLDELMAMTDKSFSTSEECNGCGICARVCPVANISLENKKPVWLNHCQNCLACYNWCPNKAIKGGVTQTGYYYRNPQIDITEFML
jgi:ferredoxin/flavodoxin